MTCRLRRTLRIAGRALLGAFIGLVFLLGMLVLTNPDPQASPGWDRHADLPDRNSETASAVVGDRLFVVGGFENLYGTSRDVFVFDATGGTWSEGPDLPDPRHHAAAVGFFGSVYVSGGGGGVLDWDPRDDLWVLSPDREAWQPLEPMPEGRVGHAMVALGESLYVVGGEGETHDLLVYTPGEGWERGPEVPGGLRDHVRAVAADDRIYVLGGRDGDLTDRVDVFDPTEPSWHEAPPLPEPMSAMAVGVIGDQVHVVGGEDPSLLGGGVIDEHFVFDLRREQWRDAAEPMLATHGAASGVIGGQLYVVGGASRQGPLSVLSFTSVTQSFSPPR